MKEQDSLRRFLFERLGVRGEWVRLEDSFGQAKEYQDLPEAVVSQFGQALAAVTLLSATIKFKGSMVLQAQGNGALKALVAQATDERGIRGLARHAGDVTGETLQQMMGQGRMVLTIESAIGDPYQGVVSLDGEGLSGVIENYFQQSEQLPTRLWLFADDSCAVGLFLQALPDQEGYEADWERIEMLANTVTEAELMSLDCEQMLYRLFNEEKVRLFEAETVSFQCQCSREKITTTLKTLEPEELRAVLDEQGAVEVGCEFCKKRYDFNRKAVEAILAEAWP